MPTTFTPWRPVEMLEQPCADISFLRNSDAAVEVTMHFSRVKDGVQKDLRLLFNDALGFRWMEDLAEVMAGESLPPLPKCTDPRWRNWTVPLLVADDSKWATDVAKHPQFTTARHFLLVSMNDIVEVLARPSVTATWIAPNEV